MADILDHPLVPSPDAVESSVGGKTILRKISLAAREFGFRARTTFEDGLRRTVDWYRRTRSEEPR